MSLKYIGPYRIWKKLGQVDYELELPQELFFMHPVFHMSLLKQVIVDLSLIAPMETIKINKDLSYE